LGLLAWKYAIWQPWPAPKYKCALFTFSQKLSELLFRSSEQKWIHARHTSCTFTMSHMYICTYVCGA
jgi:hypothetical protein